MLQWDWFDMEWLMLDRDCGNTLLLDEGHSRVQMKQGSRVGGKMPATIYHTQRSQAAVRIYNPAYCGFTCEPLVARHVDEEDQAHVAWSSHSRQPIELPLPSSHVAQ